MWTCDNIIFIISLINQISLLSHSEEIMGCKVFLDVMLPVLSILGESIVHGLHGEFEWLGSRGPVLLLSQTQSNSPHPV